MVRLLSALPLRTRPRLVTAGSKFAVDQPITRIFALFLFTLGDGLLVTMLGLMVGYTMLSLWIIAQPIVSSRFS